MGKEHLGELEQMVLLAVLRLGEDAYGARIQREVEGTAGIFTQRRRDAD